jgi:probable phosphoglycerate mutase
MRLILLRHGESKHGVEHFIAGKAGCTGLTTHGIQQAEQLAQRLQSNAADCDVVLSTSVKRAQQTAMMIGNQLNKPVQINDDLCEQLPGDADGLSWAAYRQQYGEFDVQARPNTPFSPNGESWNQFVERVQIALDRLAHTYHNQNVVAVTHAGFIVVSFLLLFEAPFSRQRYGSRNRAELHPRHASITEWQVADGAWQLVRFNDTSHL